MKLSLDSLSVPAVVAGAAKLPPPASRVAVPAPLNLEQSRAVSMMQEFIEDGSQPFFLLEGSAGTGKTYCIKDLVNRIRGRMVFTAPTNKATKVLRESVTTDEYKPECRTIFSLLGLRLEANGEVKELTSPEEPLDLTKFLAVVVDEAYMINKRLMTYIRETAKAQGVQFIFMGDPAQLQPIGETMSPVSEISNKAVLTKVMRHDNQILKLCTAIRGKVNHPAPSFTIESDNHAGEGVWVMRSTEFITRLREYAHAGWFSKPNAAKAIAWRNVTVDSLNKLVRSAIFDNTLEQWCEGDRITLLEPAKAPDGEDVGHTDDEGSVTRVNVTWHPKYGQFKCYALSVVFDDNHHGTVWLIHDDSKRDFDAEVQRLAAEARVNGRMWRKFWAFKESFHAARHAYATTAHRAQGSTYQVAFVDYRDILVNRNRQEAARCLYVACSRPKGELYLA